MSGDPTRDGAANHNPMVMETANAFLEACRRAVEAKDWPGLGDLIGLPQLFISGEPHLIVEVIETVTELTKDLIDFEMEFTDVTPLITTEDRVDMTFMAKVLWTNRNTFEEQSLEVSGHSGYIYDRSAWRPAYLFLRNARELGGPQPPVPEPMKPAAGPEAPLSDEAIAAAAEMYFRRSDVPPPPIEAAGPPIDAPPERATSSARPRKHLIYLPVIIDDDLARELFGKS